MNFGIGIGDIVIVSSLAWKLYKAFKDSGDGFKQVSADLMSLHAVLRETEDYMQEHSDMDTSRQHRLQIIIDGCKPALGELEAIFIRYDNLGTQAQRAWDRVQFGMKDLTELRSRVVFSTTMLNAFNIALINSSTMRIERRLTKFMAEVQAGLREGSVVTVENAAETIDTAEVWTEFRRELEDVGIGPAVVEENKEYIAKWIKDALREGLLDESVPDSESDRRPSNFSTLSKSSILSGDTLTGSGYGGSEYNRRPSTVSIALANQEFERHFEKEGPKKLPAFTPAPLTRSSTSKLKKRMDVGRMLQRVMVKDIAIIEAASDGNMKRVAELVDVGVNVNANDRWGWSALSMCAYGGHTDIARHLLDHGADLDNIDVDGDTPTSLAATRGHTDLVVLFDETRELRDLQLRESQFDKVRWDKRAL